MGRARGHGQAVAASGFETLFGSRRGSAGAQAARDSAEHEALGLALDDFTAAASRVIVDPTMRLAVEELIRGYFAARPPAELADELFERYLQPATGLRLVSVLEGVSLLIALEDPAACPALTAPAIEALRRYFAADQLGDGAVANESQQLELVVECLCTGPHDLAYYERIAPVAQSLVGLITRQPSTTASLRVVSALDDAPAGTVAGPLRCWADAMAARRDIYLLTEQEGDALRALIADFEAQQQTADLAACAALVARFAAPAHS